METYNDLVRGGQQHISSEDIDALGIDPAQNEKKQAEAEKLQGAPLQDQVWHQLKQVFDPEIPVDIVNLGLIYRCEVTSLGNGERSVSVDMTLTAPGCGMGEVLVEDAREKIAVVPTVSDVIVELVFDPPWNVGMMTEEARLQTGMM